MLVAILSASLFAVFWTYVGYPLLMAVLARVRSRARPPFLPANYPPAVSVVLAVRNEASRIEEKLRDLVCATRDCDTEIIVVCDHCTDSTADRATSIDAPGVRVIQHESGSPGKAGAINAGLAVANKTLVLFADVRQRLDENAVSLLSRWFQEPRIGAMSGALEIQRSEGGTGTSLDKYWSLEKKLRRWEFEFDSSIGCTGAIYMIRRELFRPIPEDTLLDDVIIPMQIAVQGFRVGFDPEAVAFDPQPLAGETESRRKTRTLGGNFQMLFRYPAWMLPWKNRLCWQLISHKYCRVLSPLFLAGAFVGAAVLAGTAFGALLFWGQVALWTLAGVGMACPQIRTKALAIPAGFAFLQISVVRGFLFWLGRRSVSGAAWK